MPTKSYSSEKYAVYTVTSDDDDDDNDDSDDSNTCCKEREELTPEGKSSSGISSFPSIPSDMSNWGRRWTRREKCFCFWNIVTILLLVGLAIAFAYLLKDRIFPKSTTDGHAEKNKANIEVITNPGSTSASPGEIKTCNTPECVRLSASVLTRMDIDADPCEDFHEYSCGGFKQKTPLSWQTPRVREDPDELNSRYDAFLIDTLSSSKATSDLGLSVVRRIYQSCVKNDMTMAGAQKSVKELLITDLENSDDNEVNSFTWMLATSHRDFGASPFFSVFVLKDGKIAIFNRYSDKLIKSLLTAGITVPNFRYLMPSDFYFRKASSDGILQGYLKFYKSTLQYLLGNDTRDLNVSNLNDSLMNSAEFEFRVIQALYDEMSTNLSDEIRNCSQRMRIGTLQRYYGGYQINWKLFFEVYLDKKISSSMELCYVDLSSELTKVMKNSEVRTMKHYVKYHTIMNTDLILTFQNRISIFSLSTSVYNSIYLQKDIESNCLNLVKHIFPLSATINSPLRRVFEGRSKSLFINIKSALMETVNDIYWIPVEQRHALIASIKTVSFAFDWSSISRKLLGNYYSSISVVSRDDFFLTIIRALKLNKNRLTRGFHVTRVFSDSLSIFDRWNSEIVISAAAAQVPLVYNSSATSFLFGPTGSFIAQTLACLFDIEALLHHFMSGTINQEVVLTLAHHLQCLVKNYGNYSIVDSHGNRHSIKGDVSKSSNFRDNLALVILHKAYISYQGQYKGIRLPALGVTDDQLIFILYAQTICENVNERGIDLYYLHDQHINGLPGYLRIRGVMSNFPRFAEVFNCPKKSLLNPKDKCIIF